MGNSSPLGSWLVSHFCPEDWSCPSLQYPCTFSDWLHGKRVRSISYSLFLFQCLKQYVELLIKEGLETAISCPDSACPKRGHLLENEVLFTEMFFNCIICLRDICNSGIEGARAKCIVPSSFRLYFSVYSCLLLRIWYYIYTHTRINVSEFMITKLW